MRPAGHESLEADLRRVVAGEVRFDAMTRVLYASDASSYQIEPLGVVRPRDADDVAAAVTVCADHNAPIVPRGGGSGLAGQAIGRGVILDCSAHLSHVEIDAERRVARVGSGTVLDRLNQEAAIHGLAFGPDPASSDRACVGGVIGNNATGAHSIVYGTSADHIRSADVVLADGSRARLGPTTRDRATAGDRGPSAMRIEAALAQLVERHGDAILAAFPPYWRRSGGYGLDRLVRGVREAGRMNPSVLLAGSEGTLAVATSFELGLAPVPPVRGLLVAHFSDPLDPFRAVPALLATHPSAVELVDRMLLAFAREAPGYTADAALVEGDPEALLIVEYSGDTRAGVRRGLEAGTRALRAEGFGGAVVRAEAPEQQARVWRVRKAGLGLLMRMRGDHKPVAGIEDTAVPPEVLADYMADIRRLLADLRVDAAFYAHASAGCIHVRPILNLKTAEGVATLETLIGETARLAMAYGGVPSSEHGDGLARGALNREVFGDEMVALFESLKATFDPDGLLNPGKVVGCQRPTENLRYGPAYRTTSFPARFAYRDDGDVTRAIEQCNGAGVCRKLDTGTMCPSYMVTLDEEHSTRGRANALRAVLDGRLPPDALVSDRLAEVMSLCVGCKACKTECPSGVDMARLKIEVSATRHAARGTPLQAHLFGRIHALERTLAPVAPLVNAGASSPLWGLAARRLGVAPQRRFPRLSRDTFDRWWARRTAPRATGQPAVVLFADTFATYQEPTIGRAAVAVLEAAGYRVIVPARDCCGRPALSQGLVDEAVRSLRANLSALAPLARRGLPIVVPEPSCASAFRDEMPDLLTGPGESADVRRVAGAVRTLDEFVAEMSDDALHLEPGPARALLHVHCHQRAHAGTAPSIAALERIPGLTVQEPDAGCCGMAGAFGYQAEQLAVSLAMAERRLAPAVRSWPPGAAIAAPGASCRQQIADTTGRRAVHPIEIVAGCLPRT